MAQSQVAAPSLGDASGSGLWESPGAVGEQPLDIWARLPMPRATQPSIAVTVAPDRTDISQVLSAWRAAERQLDEHLEASPIRALIQSEIARLRAEYQRLFAHKVR